MPFSVLNGGTATTARAPAPPARHASRRLPLPFPGPILLTHPLSAEAMHRPALISGSRTALRSLKKITASMFCYLWEYLVRPERVEAFVEHYRPGGTWADFFARSADYVDTRLLRDRDDPTHFITVDTWTSATSHAAFCRQFRSEFDALDARCEALTISEEHIGDFETN